MARSLRDIRHKIKAIKATRQVTKAMELVAASKMRRAVQNAQTLRNYALTAWRILQRIAKLHPEGHPYLLSRPTAKILVILFTSDRGLCGNLNAQMFRTTQQYLRALEQVKDLQSVEFIAVGKKGQQFLNRSNRKVVAAFDALSNHPSFKDILPIARIASQGFLSGAYDQITVIYADFISALVQEATVKVLLPLSETDLKTMLESLLPRRHNREDTLQDQEEAAEYLFEPSQTEVLELIIPQLTEMQLYQSALEAAASEHSARMVAMRNATDNASDILDDLTLVYNRTRQEKITAELAELSASKAALS